MRNLSIVCLALYVAHRRPTQYNAMKPMSEQLPYDTYLHRATRRFGIRMLRHAAEETLSSRGCLMHHLQCLHPQPLAAAAAAPAASACTAACMVLAMLWSGMHGCRTWRYSSLCGHSAAWVLYQSLTGRMQNYTLRALLLVAA